MALDLSAVEEPILKPENWEENVARCISPNYEVYLSFVPKLTIKKVVLVATPVDDMVLVVVRCPC